MDIDDPGPVFSLVLLATGHLLIETAMKPEELPAFLRELAEAIETGAAPLLEIKEGATDG